MSAIGQRLMILMYDIVFLDESAHRDRTVPRPSKLHFRSPRKTSESRIIAIRKAKQSRDPSAHSQKRFSNLGILLDAVWIVADKERPWKAGITTIASFFQLSPVDTQRLKNMIKQKVREDLVFESQSPKKKLKSLQSNRRPLTCIEPTSNRKDEKSTGLHDLPVELLYEILLFSLNPSFTLVCRRLHWVFKSTSPHFRANYILKAARPLDDQEIDYPRAWWRCKLLSWLCFGICDIEVLQLLISWTRVPRIRDGWDPDFDIYKLDLPKRILRCFSRTSSESEETLSAQQAAAMAFLRYLLGPIELPGPCPDQGSDSDQPLILKQYGNPDSHRGYFLARAVHLNHEPLVDLLLAHGASPLEKDGVAVKFAIGRKDERMVRKLISKCRTSDLQYGSLGQELLKYSVKVDARDIAYFFIREQRVAPSLETLKLLK